MRSEPGAYLLIWPNRQKTRVQIGRWREMAIKPGYYIYVGSALGPGGVYARVSRHFRSSKPQRWHIDFLTAIAPPQVAWYRHESKRLEHEWGRALSGMKGLFPIQGFGCSDCKCRSHLFFSVKPPELTKFETIIGCKLDTWRGPICGE